MSEQLQKKESELLALLRPENNSNFELIYKEGLDESVINDTVWKQTKEINSQTEVARNLLHSMNMEEAEIKIEETFSGVESLLQFVRQVQEENAKKYATLHENFNITQALEESLTTYFFQQFIYSGALAPITDKKIENTFSNSIYLSASLNISRELIRFAINQAADSNTRELFRVKRLVDALNNEFIQFKWPNGNLRRKFDGIKYDVKQLEELVYQLSLVGLTDSSNTLSKDENIKNVKEIHSQEDKDKDEKFLVSPSSFEIFRAEMDEYEDVRSSVIKGVRDAQKNAKNSIHLSLQGKLDEADQLLQRTKTDALKYQPKIDRYPSLRSGAYGGVIEEYGEGMLVWHWKKNWHLATLEEIGLCSTFEYLGALSDFTGELQRLAVKFATSRDYESVRKCLLIANYIEGQFVKCKSVSSISKKYEAVKSNVRKLELLHYQMMLTTKSIVFSSSSPDTISNPTIEANDNDKGR